MTTKNLKAAIRGYTLADYLTMEAAQAEETLADYLNGRDIATHATHYAAAHGWAYTPEVHAHTVQAIPDDIGTVGYYSGSVPLGSPVGVTVLAGHVNDAAVGPGALARLSEVRVGDVVSVAGAAGGRVSRWVVDGVTVSGKGELPAFPVVGPRRLVVVTCGGELVRVDGGGSYADNVVVWASPA